MQRHAELTHDGILYPQESAGGVFVGLMEVVRCVNERRPFYDDNGVVDPCVLS